MEQLLEQLNNVLEKSPVKDDVNRIVKHVLLNREKERRGLKPERMCLNMAYLTGTEEEKTEVLRLIAEIYHAAGILTGGQLVNVHGKDMIGEFIGQTPVIVDKYVNEAVGGILLINEADSISHEMVPQGFDGDAIAQLLKRMEDDRDNLVIVFSGEPEPVRGFLASNPGLRTKIPFIIGG